MAAVTTGNIVQALHNNTFHRGAYLYRLMNWLKPVGVLCFRQTHCYHNYSNVSACYFGHTGLIFDGEGRHVWQKHYHTFIQMTGHTELDHIFVGRELLRTISASALVFQENKKN